MSSDSPPPIWYEPPPEPAPTCSGYPWTYRCHEDASTTRDFEDIDDVPLCQACAAQRDADVRENVEGREP